MRQLLRHHLWVKNLWKYSVCGKNSRISSSNENQPCGQVFQRIISTKRKESPVYTSICRKIQLSGPISVAEFMREVLTNPLGGYYIYRDMLGRHGDFVTSPEMNQMFGELIAIWFISEWEALGSPKSFRFVEFGPGHGTLAEDILRTFHQLNHVMKDVDISFHFVEISKKLSEVQFRKLSVTQRNENDVNDNIEWYQTGLTKHGIPLTWHRSIDNIPDDKLTFYMAHEFFDALPIHKFVKTKDGWREIFVDLKPNSEKGLRQVVLPEITVASHSLIQENESRKHVEVCPEGGAIAQKIARRIEKNGGASLIVDYGHNGEKEDTLRGFRDHKVNEIFENVGEADLTADVDFRYICDAVKSFDIKISGPIFQQTFLKNMGIEVRLMMLLRNCKDLDERKKLVESYKVIMDEKQMGERFKFLSFTSKNRRSLNDPDASVTGFQNEA